MKRCILSLFAVAVTTSLFAQGSLTPPGAPAALFKTLDQVKPGTPINSTPFIITRAGSYYLTTNLVVASGDAINISTNNVMLDLNGFTITSTAASANGMAVSIAANLRNITVVNGFIESGTTNNGTGNYSGPGFQSGVYAAGTPFNIRVTGVSITGVSARGIVLSVGGNGNNTIVESCTVRTSGGNGITASIVRGCVATECNNSAITGDQVSDCYGSSTAGGAGVQGITIQNSTGYSSTGTGLNANNNAINCFGSSVAGTGLYAYNAAFCTGYRPGGVAISATIANGCIVQFGGGGSVSVVNKYNMP
jgi:hypothetical protein